MQSIANTPRGLAQTLDSAQLIGFMRRVFGFKQSAARGIILSLYSLLRSKQYGGLVEVRDLFKTFVTVRTRGGGPQSGVARQPVMNSRRSCLSTDHGSIIG